MSEILKIAAYMSMGNMPAWSPSVKKADGLLAFCREDPEVAAAAAKLFQQQKTGWIVLSGGIGKDSGEQSKAAGSEAAYQKTLLVGKHGVPREYIYTETKAENGAQNSRFGIDTILSNGLPHKRVILLMPPRSARRLYAVHTKIAREEKRFEALYQVVCIKDHSNLSNEAHRKELLTEFLRLADWPEKGWSDPQPDLSEDLVAWARAYTSV